MDRGHARVPANDPRARARGLSTNDSCPLTVKYAELPSTLTPAGVEPFRWDDQTMEPTNMNLPGLTPKKPPGLSVGPMLALVYGIPLAIIVLTVAGWRHWNPAFEVAHESQIFDVASGTWDWAGSDGFCVRDPHSISFDDDLTIMRLTHREPYVHEDGTEQFTWEYDIVLHDRRRIRAIMRGETRFTETGDPVVWDLVLKSADVYRWKQTHLPVFGYSDENRRCETAFVPSFSPPPDSLAAEPIQRGGDSR
jgi:hypothetical protein